MNTLNTTKTFDCKLEELPNAVCNFLENEKSNFQVESEPQPHDYMPDAWVFKIKEYDDEEGESYAHDFTAIQRVDGFEVDLLLSY